MKRLLLYISLYLPMVGLAQSASAPLRPFIAFDDSVIALTHCTLADVIALKAVPDQTVIVRGGVINAIGASAGIVLPKGARVVDCTGKSLLPGLVLMHEHMYYPAYAPDLSYIHFKQLPVTFPKLYLACGATMVR